jgi:hypothetical protein
MRVGPAVAIPAAVEKVRECLLLSGVRTLEVMCGELCVWVCVCDCCCGRDPAIMGVGPAVAIPAAVEKVRKGLLSSLFGTLQLLCGELCVCVIACMRECVRA